MSSLKEYTFAEVATHNTRDDLFLVIHDEVYEVSKFIAEHPGGEEVLIEYAGKNATEPFDDVGHSQDAKDILTKYHVGTIVESERGSNVKVKKEKKKLCLIALSGIALGIGIGLILMIKTLKSK